MVVFAVTGSKMNLNISILGLSASCVKFVPEETAHGSINVSSRSQMSWGSYRTESPLRRTCWNSNGSSIKVRPFAHERATQHSSLNQVLVATTFGPGPWAEAVALELLDRALG